MPEDGLCGWTRIAFKESLKGRHKETLVGAILIRGGNVIARASNLSRPFGDMNRGFHAEERLLRHVQNTKGCTVVVIRSTHKGRLSTMSRPCKKCFPLLRKKGIKKVIYLNWEGEVEHERIRYKN